MPYCNKNDVIFYGQFSSGEFGGVGYDEEASYQKAIQDAEHRIEEYCGVPEGFFNAGGIEIQNEYLNGADVAYEGGVTKFFNWYYGGVNHLKFHYGSTTAGVGKVLSVTKLEEETSAGTWTTRTEGTGNDYIVVDDGVRYVQNTPAYKYKNVRVTYKVGFARTPQAVTEVCAELASRILQNIQDRNERKNASTGNINTTLQPLKEIFTDDMKDRLQKYKRVSYAFVPG